MDELYEEVARLIFDLKECVALTGAGISAESGIPTFRSKGGMWEKYDPAVYASNMTLRYMLQSRCLDKIHPSTGLYGVISSETMMATARMRDTMPW